MKNYYEILGVGEKAGEEEIRKRYRKLAMEFHPDRNPDNPNAEEKFKEIAEAYGVLTDPKKRREYDLFRAAPGGSQRKYTQANQNGGFSYSQEDILKDLFQDPRFQQMFHGLLREFQRSGLRASPHFLRQSFFGGKGRVLIGGLFIFGSLAGPALLRGGRKALPGGKSVLKKIGHSVGKLLGKKEEVRPEVQPALDITYQTPLTQAELAEGKVTEVVSYGARGREVFKVTIPPGSRYGQRLRLKGKGRHQEGERGDLYLKLVKK